MILFDAVCWLLFAAGIAMIVYAIRIFKNSIGKW